MINNSYPNPLVSFVVTAYNTEKYLADCLDSILCQEGKYDFEIILIDDYSTDNTESIARSYTDRRLHYIRHKTNQGAFATINEGFAKAQGKYIARIDSDDRYRSYFLTKTIPILEKYPEVGLIYGDIAMINENGEITSPSNNVNRGNLPQKGNELIALLEKNYVCAPTIIARKEAWNNALPIPDGFNFCDWYLSLKIAQTWDFFFLKDVMADYRIHSQNMHKTMIQEKWGEKITWKILDDIFNDPIRQSDKTKVKKQIYASNYLILADKYFGHLMNNDARRCYLQAFFNKPDYLFNINIVRHFFASCLNRELYENIKSLAKGGL